MDAPDDKFLYEPCNKSLLDRIILLENHFNAIAKEVQKIPVGDFSNLFESKKEISKASNTMVLEFMFEMVHKDFQLPCYFYLKQFYSHKKIKEKIVDDFICADQPEFSISISDELSRVMDDIE